MGRRLRPDSFTLSVCGLCLQAAGASARKVHVCVTDIRAYEPNEVFKSHQSFLDTENTSSISAVYFKFTFSFH